MNAAAWTLHGRLAVLRAVAAGESPWSGWDDGIAAKTGEASDAYAERKSLITGLRRDGMLTDNNHLTAEGRALVALERQHG